MFLLIDNYDSFTFNLVHAFAVAGQVPVVLKNDDVRILEYADAGVIERVCISPGPGRPEDAGLCLPFLAKLETSVPVLGVCLGHQILGAHLGGGIVQAPQIIHGRSSEIMHNGKRIFHALETPMVVGRYHSLMLDAADSDADWAVDAWWDSPDGGRVVMAVQARKRPWFGIQFHPESVLTPSGPVLLANFLTVKGGRSRSPDAQQDREKKK